jgi:adenylate kinase family enzyme
MQRVLLFGCSGAGKSTFSRRLAEATGLPRTELDAVFWQPGWVMTPRSESFPKIEALCAEPAWILDGNYTSSLHIRISRADTAILLDYPRHVCMRQVLTRTMNDYGRVRDGMAEGCPEQFSLSFLRYVWNFNRIERPKLLEALDKHGQHVKLHKLHSHGESEDFLASLLQG